MSSRIRFSVPSWIVTLVILAKCFMIYNCSERKDCSMENILLKFWSIRIQIHQRSVRQSVISARNNNKRTQGISRQKKKSVESFRENSTIQQYYSSLRCKNTVPAHAETLRKGLLLWHCPFRARLLELFQRFTQFLKVFPIKITSSLQPSGRDEYYKNSTQITSDILT